MPAGTLASPDSQGHGGCDHGQARQLGKCRHAGAGGTIIRCLSGHRCSDPCCCTARNKLKTVAPAVVLYPPRNTASNVALRAFPARVPAARSRIQNMNVNPFVPGHYAGARFCCTGATVTGGRTGVRWKSLDKFWALPLGLRVCPQGTTGVEGSFRGCALRCSPEPNLHPLILSGAEEFSIIFIQAIVFLEAGPSTPPHCAPLKPPRRRVATPPTSSSARESLLRRTA